MDKGSRIMKLSEEIKKKIVKENVLWLDNYGKNNIEERHQKGQYFTPSSLIIKMIEKLDCIDPEEDYLDPAAGNGNILAALMIAGVRPEHIYCNELDPDMLLIAYDRLEELALKLYGKRIPTEHFRHCDARTDAAYFGR